jgi:hypothetical protein
VIICISYQLKDQSGNEYPAAGLCLDNFSYLLFFVCQLGCDNVIEKLWTATVSLEAKLISYIFMWVILKLFCGNILNKISISIMSCWEFGDIGFYKYCSNMDDSIRLFFSKTRQIIMVDIRIKLH